ncbi:MAG: PilZ domain-containing protein [Acidobacteria bacterium]|nr:PilZ domain-containing protein [Acidobacteriota bacterium]
MQSDQRKTQRFELRLPMELVRRGGETGKVTETRNVSSGGVLFNTEAQVQVGEPIEYFITLPTSGRDLSPVRLHCVGTVIRMEPRQHLRPRKNRSPWRRRWSVTSLFESGAKCRPMVRTSSS